MVKSLISLLAVPSLLAGVSQALHFTNDIPVDAYYEEGTDFVLTWDKETREDTFKLSVSSFLANPILVSPNGGPLGSPVYDYKGINVVLDEAVKFTDSSYTWKVATQDNRNGSEWYYSFAAEYGFGGDSPRSFHLKV
ncbi:hypothetical protein F4808DRAFT_455980 [Astrocystis sublimbata]|nr:hypothetical protein F4808DRAFT_455980 [Astrocystis sublimbata]